MRDGLYFELGSPCGQAGRQRYAAPVSKRDIPFLVEAITNQVFPIAYRMPFLESWKDKYSYTSQGKGWMKAIRLSASAPTGLPAGSRWTSVNDILNS